MDCVDVDDQQQQPKFIMTCSSAPCHRGGDKSHLQKGRWPQTGEVGCLHRRWWCCPPSEKLDGLCCGQRWCSHCCSQNPSLTWWSGYKTKKYLYDCKKNHIYTFLFFFFFFWHISGKSPSDSPPPCVHISLQSKEQVSEQPLVHWWPFEFWDAEHGCAWAGAKLPPLFLCHGHAPETQVNT